MKTTTTYSKIAKIEYVFSDYDIQRALMHYFKIDPKDAREKFDLVNYLSEEDERVRAVLVLSFETQTENKQED